MGGSLWEERRRGGVWEQLLECWAELLQVPVPSATTVHVRPSQPLDPALAPPERRITPAPPHTPHRLQLKRKLAKLKEKAVQKNNWPGRGGSKGAPGLDEVLPPVGGVRQAAGWRGVVLSWPQLGSVAWPLCARRCSRWLGAVPG